MAGTSDAMKYSFSPKPTINGLSFLTPMTLSGSKVDITAKA